MSRGKKWGIALVALVAIGVLVDQFTPAREAFILWRAGSFDKADKVKYRGDLEDSLKKLRAALMLYHDSEGQFPDAAGWMDAIRNRVRTGNMADSEAMKKFMDPSAQTGAEGVYGIAMNDAFSGQYIDDVKDLDKTPLLFVSSDTKWNAHGTPEKLLPKPAREAGNWAIMVDGKILEL
ncbi:MAG: hypothetical protein KF784_11945 [Fimbriimonadaceae bacterium]|nr:hypothetical protein [Fimbriimonadaceae bacterium]